MGDIPSTPDRGDLAGRMVVHPNGEEEAMKWCREVLAIDATDTDASGRGVTSHRRTYSAPTCLKDVAGSTGKRSTRSPRTVTGCAGAKAGIDPFHDIRSPVYKKHGAADDSDLGTFTEARELDQAATHHRSQSFDAAMQAHRDSPFTPADDPSGTTGSSSYRCRRCGDESRNHICAAADGRSSETARDSKTIPWTSAEDKVICEGVEVHGFKWSLISSSLPGRTDNAVRNRWHRLEQARRWREEVQAQYKAAQGDDSDTVTMPGSAYPGYKCRRCGQPKRGHVCPYEDTTQLPAPRPLPPPQPARKERGARSAQDKTDGQGSRSLPPRGPVPKAGNRMAQQPTTRGLQRIHRPPTAPSISVVPPPAHMDVCATSMAVGKVPSPLALAHPSPPLSAHLSRLESGVDHEMINVGDLGARRTLPPRRLLPHVSSRVVTHPPRRGSALWLHAPRPVGAAGQLAAQGLGHDELAHASYARERASRDPRHDTQRRTARRRRGSCAQA